MSLHGLKAHANEPSLRLYDIFSLSQSDFFGRGDFLLHRDFQLTMGGGFRMRSTFPRSEPRPEIVSCLFLFRPLPRLPRAESFLPDAKFLGFLTRRTNCSCQLSSCSEIMRLKRKPSPRAPEGSPAQPLHSRSVKFPLVFGARFSATVSGSGQRRLPTETAIGCGQCKIIARGADAPTSSRANMGCQTQRFRFRALF